MSLASRADKELAVIDATGQRLDKRNATPTVMLISAASVTPRAIQWLWYPFLSRGKLQILAGPPGAGKTTLALAIAATVTRGGKWPDGTDAPKGRVLIWSGEDDITDTLVPRLLACNADLSMVDFVKSTFSENGARDFKPSTDMSYVEDAIRESPPALFIVDPIVSAIAGDSHKNAEVRKGLEPLRNLAERHLTTVLGISHFSKGTKGNDVVERVTGSIAFGAACRGILAAAKLPEDDDRGSRLFCIAKSNVGPDEGGFTFDIEIVDLGDGITATRTVWGQPLDGTAYDTDRMADKTVHEAASRLLHDCKVAARLEALQRAAANRAEIKQADILLSARRAMNLNPTKILGPNGNYLPHTEWPEDINLCIDGFVIKQIPGTDGEVVTVQFSSRTAARDQLMEYCGMYEKHNAKRADGILAHLDGMSDESLAAMEEILESVLQDSNARQRPSNQ